MKPEIHDVTIKHYGPMSEISPDFVDKMWRRMCVSFHKYGAVADAYPHKVNALESMQKRLDLYRATGNTEYLVDAANFVCIEYMCPSVENAFFEATDSDGSPGRVWVDGTESAKRNVC